MSNKIMHTRIIIIIIMMIFFACVCACACACMRVCMCVWIVCSRWNARKRRGACWWRSTSLSPPLSSCILEAKVNFNKSLCEDGRCAVPVLAITHLLSYDCSFKLMRSWPTRSLTLPALFIHSYLPLPSQHPNIPLTFFTLICITMFYNYLYYYKYLSTIIMHTSFFRCFSSFLK